jgi:hypothetical protein
MLSMEIPNLLKLVIYTNKQESAEYAVLEKRGRERGEDAV